MYYLYSTPEELPVAVASNLWTPANLTSVVLEGWYRVHDVTNVVADGADLTISAGCVTAWADRSGHARNLTAVTNTGAVTPNYTATNLGGTNPGVYFNYGAALYATGFTYTANAVIGAMMVGEVDSSGRLVSVVSNSGNDYDTGGAIPIESDSTSITNNNYWWNGNTSVSPTFTANTVNIFEGVPLSSSTAASGVNAVDSTALTGMSEAGVTMTKLGIFSQAGSSGTAGALAGTVAETVIWSGVISAGELAQLQGYIAWANGQQGLLPSGHTYKAAPPTLAAPSVYSPQFIPHGVEHGPKISRLHMKFALNGSYPPPPAVVTVTGGTLPFMGVG